MSILLHGGAGIGSRANSREIGFARHYRIGSRRLRKRSCFENLQDHYVHRDEAHSCFDGSRLYSPSMWTTFSQVDGLMQIQNYVDQNDYWNPYPWKFNVYEQRQVKNCIWSGCIGTYYPTASGWMSGSGSVYGEISAG